MIQAVFRAAMWTSMIAVIPFLLTARAGSDEPARFGYGEGRSEAKGGTGYMDIDGGRFWRGPIKSVPHAQKITGYAAGTFAVIGALYGLSALAGGTLNAGVVVAVLIIVVPALSLLRTRGVVAASILFGFGLLGAFGAVATSLYMAMGGDLGLGLGMLVVGLLWALPALAGFRGVQAARYLRRERRASAARPTAIDHGGGEWTAR